MGTDSCVQSSQEWIDTNLTCKMNKAYAVTIPKKLREKLGLEPMSPVILVVDNQSILLSTKSIDESLDIQSHINDNGSFYMPKEIRDQLILAPGTTFRIRVGSDPAQFCELLLEKV
ncbi:AbrB/MazE/SpoVT family DNA-binding domain-containing protein [Alteribacter keqinensis]|uniref:AbrB/MazE/SpoVT family DNA-binding domain-containing protein n=1 Tax=Alteribacter keqinensis TaxID=2483800 RepID=A0A3M7TLP4_9BACI|nr:AbrB/MazE/SpoVT family DNA-binding domain-containing protein [Alteribacter keqinensis]RNA66318.1 AbrB/MazE/SpoVT family DNA-binding domain-containing protein [Alteribacter keqinensis]